MYELYLESRAEKDLRRLNAIDFKRIIRRIKILALDPRPKGCCKLVDSENDWRIRIGNYRVIYEIDEKVKEVRIMRVRHRREVY
ncbi:MAG: type II toxin-antitoxin system RelE/ParE family toxin [candidate division WOR-3 bacterium]|nr:type II toxin-antitoxin system RelE/ParE family toxin [candidate division WOR-3 bacterium]